MAAAPTKAFAPRGLLFSSPRALMRSTTTASSLRLLPVTRNLAAAPTMVARPFSLSQYRRRPAGGTEFPSSPGAPNTAASVSSPLSTACIATPDVARQDAITAGLVPLLAPTGQSGVMSAESTRSGSGNGRWQVTLDGRHIGRTIALGNAVSARKFIEAIRSAAATAKHDPTGLKLNEEDNTIALRWGTHRDRTSGMAGLTELDVKMAGLSDELAAKYGEQS